MSLELAVWYIHSRRGRGCMGFQSLNTSYCPEGEAWGTVWGMKGLKTNTSLTSSAMYVILTYQKWNWIKEKNILFYFWTPSTVQIFNPATYETTSLIRNYSVYAYSTSVMWPWQVKIVIKLMSTRWFWLHPVYLNHILFYISTDIH